MKLLRATSVLAVSSVLAMVLQALTVHLYARRLTEDDLAQYLVAMASCVIISPFISLGVTDSVLYFVGLSKDNLAQGRRVLREALGSLVFFGLLFALAAVSFPSFLSRLFFTDPHHFGLLLSIIFFVTSRCMYEAYFRYLTASQVVLLPGILQTIVMGIAPAAVIAVGWPLDVSWLIAETAMFTLLALAVPVTMTFLNRGQDERMADGVKLGRLIGYGVRRMPATLGFVILLSGPVVIAKKFDMSYMNIIIIGAAMAILRMLGITNQFMTYLVLPRLAWARAHTPRLLPDVVRMLFFASAVVSCAFSAMLIGSGDAMLSLWLNRPLQDVGSLSIYFWLAAAPLTATFFMRPAIDALHFRAYNTRNVFLSVAVLALCLVLGWFVFGSRHTIGQSVLAASGCLCILSIRSINTLVGLTGRGVVQTTSLTVVKVILPSLALVVCAICIRTLTPEGLSWKTLSALAVMGFACGMYLLYCMRRIRGAISSLAAL